MLLAASCVLALGCGDSGSAVPEDVLPGTMVIGPSDDLVMPGGMEITSNSIIMSDGEAPYLRMFNMKGELVATVGGQGEGPEEFKGVGSIGLHRGADGTDDLVVFDFRLQRVLKYKVSDSSLAIAGSPVQLVSGGSSKLGVFAGGDMVTIGAFQGGALKLYDGSGTRKAELGVVPFVSPELPQSLAQQIIAGRLAIHPSEQRLAIAARHAGRIDIYDGITGESSAVKAPLPFMPGVRTTSNGAMDVLVTDGATQFGYIDVAASSCCIYGLFSGRTRREFPETAFKGNQIHVFRWDGRLMRVVPLDHELYMVAANRDGSKLYGAIFDAQPAVYVYDMGPR